MHCAVGKDRTGFTVALALAAVGVDDELIVADYAKTYADGTNTDIDYSTDSDGNILPPETSVSYTITDM